MKIIEALKQVKLNREKIKRIQLKIHQNASHLSNETPEYANTEEQIRIWSQQALDLSLNCSNLLCRIQHTNLQTQVDIELGGNTVTKSIAEWVWRRREFAKLDEKTFQAMSSRNLRDSIDTNSQGNEVPVTVIMNYNPSNRDTAIDMYQSETHLIDSKLEIVNALTDLVD